MITIAGSIQEKVLIPLVADLYKAGFSDYSK